MRTLLHRVAVVACLAALPVISYTQTEFAASLAGVVKDASGAVLPGVTIEAASPELIEKVRSVVTDGTGQYRLINLRPGAYTVTFTLTGFATVKREGLQLTGGVVTTVNADMKVGAVAETITVTGETPVVDVQSAKRQQTLSSDVLDAIPTTRAANGILTLIPSMVQSGGANVNVQLSPGMIVFGGRGGRGNEGRLTLDGLNTGASLNGGGVSGYAYDVQNTAEVSITASGGLGEAEIGGPTMNFVPRTGGNAFKFYTYGSVTGSALANSNYTAALAAQGLKAAGVLNKLWDISGSSGGPIVKDRVWYFTTLRQRTSGSDVPGMYYNLNAGDLTKWLYAPDLTRQAKATNVSPLQPNLRLTIQASPKNKFNLFWDEQQSGTNVGAGSATAAPETASSTQGAHQRVQQATWTSTVTNRFLLEAGIGTYLSDYGGSESPSNNRDAIPVTEQCTAGCAANGNIPGLLYRSMAVWANDWIGAHTWRASASYVTGAHNMKFGYQGAFHVANAKNQDNNEHLAYRFNNGVPNQITEDLNMYQTLSRVRYDAFYAQDQWTHERLTLQGAIRYDHSWSYYPAQQVGPTVFLPTAVQFAESTGVPGYHDVTPRVGATYDVFGNGKTAVKLNMGRYLEAAVNGNGNYSALLPASRMSTSVTRTWNDANQNYVPDCNLQNPLAQGECGTISNLNFGQPVFATSYDAAILGGWGVRPGDWQVGVTVQQQVAPRISVEGAYVRRWLQNFTVTDNLAAQASDYTPFSIAAPLDPRLPGGGGYAISGLYDVNPTLFGRTNNYVTYASNFGTMTSVYNGFELSASARVVNGLQLQGGSSTGQTVVDYCSVRATLPGQNAAQATASYLPAFSPVNPYCHNAPGFTTRITGLATYTVPKIDVQLSGTIQSSPGAPLAANYSFPAAVIAQALGRPVAGNPANVTINLVGPGQVFGDRLNEFDLRIGKNLQLGRARGQVAIEVYNVLNSNAAITNNQTFIVGGQWLAPTLIMQSRIVKVTTQFNF